jgi:signal transduction histidine kinase
VTTLDPSLDQLCSTRSGHSGSGPSCGDDGVPLCARAHLQHRALKRCAEFASQGANSTLVVAEVLEVTAVVLRAERVAVWLLSSDAARLNCLARYDRPSGSHSSGPSVRRQSGCPVFEAMDSSWPSAVRELQRRGPPEDPSQAGLYGPPGGALLCAPLRAGDRVLGVLVVEDPSGPRAWLADEELYVLAAAGQVSGALLVGSQRARQLVVEEAEQALHLALAASGTSTWSGFVRDRRVVWDPSIYDLVGGEPGAMPDNFPALLEMVHEEDRARLGERLSAVVEGDEDDLNLEVRMVGLDGVPRVLALRARLLRDASGQPLRLVGACHDLTARYAAQEEQRRLERSMYHSQKLESLGVLAGGIAHDFNNLLVGVLGNASHLLSQEDNPNAEVLEEILSAATQASMLCRQLLAYSGDGRFQVQPLDLSQVIEKTSALMRFSAGSLVRVEQQLAPDLPPVEGDATQLRQVAMNLLINASEAMERKGTIELRTQRREVSQDELDRCVIRADGIQPGRLVCLEVVDAGAGMSPETMARMFDPFFSTKFTGRGLGLAAVQGIVLGHQGALLVESEPGVGTRFQLFLPPLP